MKENWLYTNIVYALYNVFNNDNLKAQLIINKKFKEKMVQQLCNLLTLEKDYDTSFDKKKLTISFAQVLADVINEVETIEKVDGATFDILNEQYIEFIKYICETFIIGRDYITRENIITLETIDKTTEFIDKNAVKNAQEKLNEKIKKEAEELKKTNYKSTNNISSGTEINFNSNQTTDINQMMQQMKNIPIHPRFDPRFYPYNSKPKYIILYKKIVACLVIAAAIGMLILWLLASSQLSFNVYTKVVSYKFSNNAYIVVGGGADWANHYAAGDSNFKNDLQPFLLLKMLGVDNQMMSLFGGLLPIIPAVYMGYELLGHKRFKREQYTIKIVTVIISTIILLYSLFSFFKMLLPNYLNLMISNFSVPNSGIKVNNDPLIFGGLLTPDSDLQTTIDKIVELLKKTLTYKIVYSITCFVIFLGIIGSISTIVLIIIAPKLDRNKLICANEEYQKALNASMRGEKYEMDSSLFDDEFKDGNPYDDKSNKK